VVDDVASGYELILINMNYHNEVVYSDSIPR